jgi:hypothetical protein
MRFLGLFLAKTANVHSLVSPSVIGKPESNTYHLTSNAKAKVSFFTKRTCSALVTGEPRRVALHPGYPEQPKRYEPASGLL